MTDLFVSFRMMHQQTKAKLDERKIAKRINKMTWATKVAIRRGLPINPFCCAYGHKQLVGNETVSVGLNTLVKSVACTGCQSGREVISGFEKSGEVPKESACALLEIQFLIVPEEVVPNTVVSTVRIDSQKKNKKPRSKFGNSKTNEALQRLTLHYK